MSVEELTQESLNETTVERVDRSEFIRKTYTHLLLAILAFMGIE